MVRAAPCACAARPAPNAGWSAGRPARRGLDPDRVPVAQLRRDPSAAASHARLLAERTALGHHVEALRATAPGYALPASGAPPLAASPHHPLAAAPIQQQQQRLAASTSGIQTSIRPGAFSPIQRQTAAPVSASTGPDPAAKTAAARAQSRCLDVKRKSCAGARDSRAETRCLDGARDTCQAVADRQLEDRKPGSKLPPAPGTEEAEGGGAAGAGKQQLLGGLGILGGAAGVVGGVLTANPILLGLGAVGMAKGVSSLVRGSLRKSRASSSTASTASSPAAAATLAGAAPQADPAAASPSVAEEAAVAVPPPVVADPAAAAPDVAAVAPEAPEAAEAPAAEAIPAAEQDDGAAQLEGHLAARGSGRFPNSSSRRAAARTGRRASRSRRRVDREKARSRRHFDQSRDRLVRRQQRDRATAPIASFRSSRASRPATVPTT